MIDALSRRLERLVGTLTGVAGALLVVMVVLINVEVAGRYLFGFSTLIADEYSGYLFVWITLLGAAHTLRQEEHLRVAMLVDRLSRTWRNRLAVAAAILGFLISTVALYATAVLVYTSYRFDTHSIQPSSTPLVWPQAILPLGFALLGIAYLEDILRRLTGRQPSPERDSAAGAGT